MIEDEKYMEWVEEVSDFNVDFANGALAAHDRYMPIIQELVEAIETEIIILTEAGLNGSAFALKQSLEKYKGES